MATESVYSQTLPSHEQDWPKRLQDNGGTCIYISTSSRVIRHDTYATHFIRSPGGVREVQICLVSTLPKAIACLPACRASKGENVLEAERLEYMFLRCKPASRPLRMTSQALQGLENSSTRLSRKCHSPRRQVCSTPDDDISCCKPLKSELGRSKLLALYSQSTRQTLARKEGSHERVIMVTINKYQTFTRSL